MLQSAATDATQPTRLTGLWVPRISRKMTAATAVWSAVEATLKVVFTRACLRTKANTKTAAPAVLSTRMLGDRKTNPIRTGASSRAHR